MATLVRSPSIDPRYACFQIVIRRSRIHRYGVYAEEFIPANCKLIEYTGERVNRREAKRRGDVKFTYLFAVGNYWTLDGAVGGRGAEIINHSCEPNLVSRVMKGHILYMRLRPIQVGEELTVDYHLDWNPPVPPCQCGTQRCRGTLELRRRRVR